MKNIFFTLIISGLFLSTGCKKTISASEPFILSGSEYSGTFNVTFKDFKNNSKKEIQKGNIHIVFGDSNYSYKGIVEQTNQDTPSILEDYGTYNLTEGKISMNDISWWAMDPRWHNSLYLKDTFSIYKDMNMLIFYQDNKFATWELKLFNKD